MRPLLLLLALAACASTSRGPAWPKSSAGSDDGGESLAPRPSAHELAAPVPTSGDEVVESKADKPVDKPAEATPSAPTTTVAPTTEEPTTTEEITIEVDDD